MASSSDWIAAMHVDDNVATDTPQGWIAEMARCAQAGTFCEGSPYTARRTPPAEAACNEEPAVDPVAEAFARGEEAGRAAAASEHAAQGEHQRGLRLTLRSLDQTAMDCLASELAATVVALCGQALEGFAADSDQLLARCKEAARRLGSGPEQLTLLLHPEDIALIDTEALEAWKVVPDETIARGGLRLEGEDGSVSDGPAEWRRAIAAAIRG